MKMSKSFTKKTCSLCNGCGLVKKSQFICKICSANNLTRCTFCEHRKYKGKYGECNICFGDGELYFNKDAKKRYFPPDE
jgi:hypothetical protein